MRTAVGALAGLALVAPLALGVADVGTAAASGASSVVAAERPASTAGHFHAEKDNSKDKKSKGDNSNGETESSEGSTSSQSSTSSRGNSGSSSSSGVAGQNALPVTTIR
ncbi:hypothetical protein SAMN05216215_102979 [Saccharopolyspora shandongensis]|uniref:Uncharacterized protein n=1 Tax=Saccharopolyspora shandongensis TaxID=418495 RepID=A0A1H3KZT4_9PSEU|nr:hypothetical protein [Saccharopolyspora shandongensis]SDY57145.1 hypothetical protein SAMN05216215_102979 [Saccharopolyspora shandongensis]